MKDLTIFSQFAKEGKSIKLRTDGKAVIYTRVSTKEQAENNASLETQLKYCKQLAIKKGLEVVEYFGGTYESAKSDERKEFQKMLNYVKRRSNIGYIIVYSYDRFSRTGANGAYISDQLKRQGIVTISATQEVDTSTSAGSFQQNLYYMFSQFDNELRRDKSVSGMQEKLRKGHWTGAYPFGYINANPGKGKTPNFVITKEGKLLKQAFLWKANDNMSHVEIAKRLQKKGLNISDKKLSDLFRNPFYCGLIVNSLIPGEIIEGKHPALISRQVFLKIHNLLNAGAETRDYSRDDENLPLKTFLRSTACGTPYTGFIVKKKGLYYYKNRRKGSKENRSAKKLHQEFLELLASYQLKDKKYVAPLKELIYDTFVKMNEEGIKESERLNKEILSLENKLDRLEERYVFEEINKVQYDKFKAKLYAEIKGKRENLSNHSFDSSNLKKSINLALKYALNLPSLWSSGDLETKRKVQYMVFPDGLGYDFQNKRVQTFRVNSIFAQIACLSDKLGANKNRNFQNNIENSCLVTMLGFKPRTS
ncbi:recombinase family protein [Tenacibaculum aquimarinum]|uniref:recombinase family protein n=1 Tax=Tenacibaculum aquimarinum TaxID=2910675 RepID=UPI001F0B46CB|nr:recombinase family protein [Tenacibaculum aquimarinum]MCH3884573.1 recombinase family protein [Tenacibaculum aquimarinum]